MGRQRVGEIHYGGALQSAGTAVDEQRRNRGKGLNEHFRLLGGFIVGRRGYGCAHDL